MADDSNGADATTRRGFIKATATAAAATVVGCGGDDVAAVDAGTDTGVGDGGAGLDTGVGPRDGGGVDGQADAGPPPIHPPEDTPENARNFETGVASGDVTHEDAIVWTRYGGSRQLMVAVYEVDATGYLRTVAERGVVPSPDGFTHASVSGLTGGARYRYVFYEMEGDERMGRSPIGRFRAALAPGVMEDLIFGACSCTENGRSMATLERAGEREDIDAFLLLGDTTYNDDIKSLAAIRRRWELNFRERGYLGLRESTSLLATWDDHEVDDNFTAETSLVPIEEGRRAFYEYLPLRRNLEERMWKSVRWGDTAELFVLDCRGERRPSRDEYISVEQMEWLKGALSESPCVFKLILNSVPIACFPSFFDVAADDRWEGFPEQRTEILSHIDDEGITGVLWVAGDFHLCSSQTVSLAGEPGATQREILAGPGAQSGNPGYLLLQRDSRFDFAVTTNNYTTIECMPMSRTVRVSWIDRDGRAFEVREYVL